MFFINDYCKLKKDNSCFSITYLSLFNDFQMKEFASLMNKFLSILLFLFGLLSIIYAQQIAFPGAEGAGRFASGGRGTAANPTTVFEVTNLSDVNSVGSFRYACSQSASKYPYRTIVFRVSGTIHLNSKLAIPANTTVAGQTAPGDGICMADFPVNLNGNNIIVRYMRFRMGDKNQLKTNKSGCGVPVAPFTDTACLPLNGSGGDDAFGGVYNQNIIIDHCTVGWGGDESLSVYRGDSVTIQWNLISEGLNYSYHFETGDKDFEHHGYGGIMGALHGTFHHNLFAHFKSRNPRFAGNSTYPTGTIESVDFRNNVIYDWGLYTAYGGEGGQYNIVNNYYKSGPSTGSATKFRIVNVDSGVSEGYAHYYLSGNYMYGSNAITKNNWSGALMMSGKAIDTVISKSNTPYIPNYMPSFTNTPQEAYDTVLKSAGVTIPNRDTLDQRIINDVQNRIGSLIDVQGGYPHATPYATTVNAWPKLNSTTAPTDSDHDGMPDSWETAHGLNPNNASDRSIVAANGYTNLENYLNGITASPTPIPTNIATATWPLSTDEKPIVVGNITAANQAIGIQLTGISYGTTLGGVNGWQSVGTSSYLPAAYNPNSYLEYKVTPVAGKKFIVNAIGMSALGGGSTAIKAAIYYSLDSFATSKAVGSCYYNGNSIAATTTTPIGLVNANTVSLSSEQIGSIPTSITVLPNQTLAVRVYVWNSTTGNRYFANQNITINGITADVPLSVTLIDFSSTMANNRVKLIWNTVDEVNMQAYKIEKSMDGTNFVSVGTVEAKNLNANIAYQFIDDAKLESTVYYRLKMMEKDGNFKYSSTISAKAIEDKQLTIFPNPVATNIFLSFNRVGANATLRVYSVQGKLLIERSLEQGSTQSYINLSGLAAGNYLLMLNNGNKIISKMILKQ